MIGATAGDIIGSVYEHYPIKTRDLLLFYPRSHNRYQRHTCRLLRRTGSGCADSPGSWTWGGIGVRPRSARDGLASQKRGLKCEHVVSHSRRKGNPAASAACQFADL